MKILNITMAAVIGFSAEIKASCHEKVAALTPIEVRIEITAGSNQKWELNKVTGDLEWQDSVEGVGGRIIDYLGYPANYGYVEGTLSPLAGGGDGDALDVLVLGDQLARGAHVSVWPVAVMRLVDQGQVDDKILAVPLRGAFSPIRTAADLRMEYPGALEILELWFENYKKDGGLEVLGWEDEAFARDTVSRGICDHLGFRQHSQN